MKLSHLEHFLIQTVDLEATKNWYVEVLGLREGPHPDFGFPVYWLYIGARDVLHLTQGGAAATDARKRYLGQDREAVEGSGVIDHVAFRAEGLDATIAHLQRLGIPFKERRADDQALYQLFLFDPNGVKVELNFAAAEAEGRKAAVMAKA
jgi:catechol 2,3-dioxygenase-like lactoylglutathione lyase family enzyme